MLDRLSSFTLGWAGGIPAGNRDDVVAVVVVVGWLSMAAVLLAEISSFIISAELFSLLLLLHDPSVSLFRFMDSLLCLPPSSSVLEPNCDLSGLQTQSSSQLHFPLGFKLVSHLEALLQSLHLLRVQSPLLAILSCLQ
nr:hypothetical protein Iba_scaffold1680361CG0010 [Ipomoea batatas]